MADTLRPVLERRLISEIRGDVRFDRFTRGRYATDASHYQIMPVGVVAPRTVEDASRAIAIARSDGTRASVTREVFRTRVEDGILGDIRFDRNGDLVDAPFTFFRIVGERTSEEGLHPDVDRVVLARSALLRTAP